jgi:glyoxylase-like metal-dependent hydrolase (beta-lactamase superfamily II)
VLDPGPEGEAHVRALAAEVQDAEEVRVVLTHGNRDHAPAAFPLAERLGVEVWGPEGLPAVDRPIAHGDVLPTDEGELVAVATPGHARHHLAFHWPSRRAAFVGDLLLGRGETTWVGEYSGCVADYLASLARLRELDAAVLYPAHGAPIEDPEAAIGRFEEHRRARIGQVEALVRERPDADEAEIAQHVYGEVVDGMHEAVLRSVRALMEHVGYPRS